MKRIPSARPEWVGMVSCRRVVLVCVLAGLAAGCRLPSKSTSSAGGEVGRPVSSGAASLERLAKSTRFSRDRSQRYIAASRAYLDEGRPSDALRCANAARRSHQPKPFESEIERLAGEAHFRMNELDLARRYLTRGLDGAEGLEKDRTLALLVALHRTRGEEGLALRYQRDIENPAAPEVLAALALRPSGAEPTPRRTFGSWAGRPRSTAPTRSPTGAPSVAPPASHSSDPSALPPITVLPRSMWNARPVDRGDTRKMTRIDKITIHHSGPPKEFHGATRWAAAQEIRRIQRYHQVNQGWADIGYHYIVDRQGEIWQGRSLEFQGAHASGAHNQGNIGIVVLGNYERGHQRLNQPQGRGLTLLVAHLSDYFGIPPQRVYTHQEITGPSHTQCPGPDISAYVAKIRSVLTDRLVAMRTRAEPALRAASYRN